MNKKKIVLCIGIAIILIIVITFGLVRVLSNNTQNFIESTVAEGAITNEILEENIVVENEIAEQNISNIVEQESVENVAQIAETEKVQATDTKITDTKEKKTQTTKVESQTQAKEEKQVNPEPQSTEVQSCIEKQVETVTPVQFTTPKKETQNSNNSSVVPEEKPKDTVQENTYVYNAQMTQQLVDIINNNPSQFMQQYGFTVSTDSSITSLTNQFTFAENRVIEKIQNKFGTIRVYAQDYYLNGEYLFTECYII